MLARGPGYRRDLDLVNALPDGSLWPPQRFTGGCRRLVRRLGFPEFESIHLWRRNFATEFAAAGGNPKELQGIMGHATFGFTFDRYVKSTAGNLKAAGALSERLFGPAREQDAHGEEAESGKA